MSRVAIGRYAVQKVVELERPFAPAQEFFPDLTDEMLASCRQGLPPGELDARDYLNLSYHCFVVKTERYTMLVDTCCGNDKDRKTRPAFDHLETNFLGALAAADVTPEQIDYVLCTHLHWDHIGWNTRLLDGSWVPTFPNAKHVIARTEYEYWDAAYARGERNIHCIGFEDSVLPLKQADQVVVVDDHHQFDAGITLAPCHGHSPGHVLITIASDGQSGVFSGDVIHHQIQLRFPSISTMADTDRDLARENRIALIHRLADTDTLLLPAHFQTPSFGRIRSADAGFRYEPVC